MYTKRRWIAALLGLLGGVCFATGVRADIASFTEPPQAERITARHVMLRADRIFGFAPMTIRLSGMLQEPDGNLSPMKGGQRVRIVVESPFLRVQSSGNFLPLVSDTHYEALSVGPDEPTAFQRSMEIRKPGTYSFRVQVLSTNGEVLNSNEVSVKVL
ncbi:MAG: hypothetical protein HY049_15690 [Acidobacteria bacterium]|nr:hypothetical protein [Acidobacteriota bacterium]